MELFAPFEIIYPGENSPTDKIQAQYVLPVILLMNYKVDK